MRIFTSESYIHGVKRTAHLTELFGSTIQTIVKELVSLFIHTFIILLRETFNEKKTILFHRLKSNIRITKDADFSI